MKKPKLFAEGGMVEDPAMAQDPGMAGGDPGMTAGNDPAAQIESAVQAYMQSPDPALADQIVQMIAQLMGITGGEGQMAPAGAPGDPAMEDPAMAPAYRTGGKIPMSAKQKYLSRRK